MYVGRQPPLIVPFAIRIPCLVVSLALGTFPLIWVGWRCAVGIVTVGMRPRTDGHYEKEKGMCSVATSERGSYGSVFRNKTTAPCDCQMTWIFRINLPCPGDSFSSLPPSLPRRPDSPDLLTWTGARRVVFWRCHRYITVLKYYMLKHHVFKNFHKSC